MNERSDMMGFVYMPEHDYKAHLDLIQSLLFARDCVGFHEKEGEEGDFIDEILMHRLEERYKNRLEISKERGINAENINFDDRFLYKIFDN